MASFLSPKSVDSAVCLSRCRRISTRLYSLASRRSSSTVDQLIVRDGLLIYQAKTDIVKARRTHQHTPAVTSNLSNTLNRLTTTTASATTPTSGRCQCLAYSECFEKTSKRDWAHLKPLDHLGCTNQQYGGMLICDRARATPVASAKTASPASFSHSDSAKQMPRVARWCLRHCGQYNGPRFYEQALSRIRDGVGRCTEEVGRADVAGWGLRRVAGLPEQTDDSSCGLFALKRMELWDGEELMQGFSTDDMHAFRTKLAKELVSSEMNEMYDVKTSFESKMTLACSGHATQHSGCTEHVDTDGRAATCKAATGPAGYVGVRKKRVQML